MAVYVDRMKAKVGYMVMCHMLADSRPELDAMADLIGVARKWIQEPGTYREHYDVSLGSRAKAIKAGAVEIDRRQVGAMLKERKKIVPKTGRA